MTTVYQSNVDTDRNPVKQTQPHSSLTTKYKHINTEQIIEVFEANGFEVDFQSFANPRNDDRKGYQKHIVAFKRDDLRIGDDHLQILVTNSHDGTSSVQLDVGVYRAVCANGLVSGMTETSMKLRHVGRVEERIDEAIKHLIEYMPMVAGKIERLKGIQLDSIAKSYFIKECVKTRLGNKAPQLGLVNLQQFKARRVGDQGDDLWTLFNVMQEYCIRQGFRWQDHEGERKHTRKVKAVKTVVDLNKKLWNVADKFAA